jgi:hypothetical protein
MTTSNTIKKNNAKFKKMSKAQKRVAIAKDVISFLELGALKAMCGRYVRPSKELSLQERCSEVQANSLNWGECQVCAKGALFVAKVNRFDNCPAWKFNSFGGDSEDMDGIFSYDQFSQIEYAFEGWDEFGWGWYSTYPNPKLRMIAIMKNIVRNKGTFKIDEL